jgi:hypothetical protein
MAGIGATLPLAGVSSNDAVALPGGEPVDQPHAGVDDADRHEVARPQQALWEAEPARPRARPAVALFIVEVQPHRPRYARRVGARDKVAAVLELLEDIVDRQKLIRHSLVSPPLGSARRGGLSEPGDGGMTLSHGTDCRRTRRGRSGSAAQPPRLLAEVRFRPRHCRNLGKLSVLWRSGLRKRAYDCAVAEPDFPGTSSRLIKRRRAGARRHYIGC